MLNTNNTIITKMAKCQECGNPQCINEECLHLTKDELAEIHMSDFDLAQLIDQSFETMLKGGE